MALPKSFLFGLLCFIRCCAEIHAVCTNLKIFDGVLDITADVNCTLLFTESCKNGPSSFPEDLGAGLSVEKPGNFTVNTMLDVFLQGQNWHRVSRLKMFWNGPSSGMGRQSLRGFYMNMRPVGSGVLKCRIFNLQNNSLVVNTNLRFQFEMFPITDEATFVIDMFSLPPPTDDELESGLYGRNIISFPGKQDLNDSIREYPIDWTTTISASLHKQNGVLEVKFSLPEINSLAHFDNYRVALFRPDKRLVAMGYVNAKGQGGYAVYNFTNVPDGSYLIQVMPNDSFFNDDNNCQCYGPDPNEILDKMCGSCSFTETSIFNVTGMPLTTSSTVHVTNPASPTTSSTVHVTNPANPTTSSTVHVTNPANSTTSTQESTTYLQQNGKAGLSDGEISAAVVIPVILVAALAVLLFKCKPFTNDNNNNDNKENNENGNNISTKPDKDSNPFYTHLVQSFTDILNPHKPITGISIPALKRKRVFLLSCEDHSYFKEAVVKFADFLTLHCQCDVTCAFSQMVSLRKANCYPWLSGNIDESDVVIIINSEAAFHLYTAFQKGQTYENAQFGPHGDLFTVGIMHICGKITLGQDVSKVIIVNFEHTSKDCRLPLDALSTRHYLLPNHLKPFLLHIHGLDSNTMDLSKVNLPLQGNIPELRGGSDWLRAVRDCHIYEQQNPEWFIVTFGEPTANTKPELIKQGSCDSGYPTSRPSSDYLDRLRRQLSSVSMQAADNPEEAIFKEHCIEPSTTGFSVYTIPYSSFTASPRPPEIDITSTISEQMRCLNDDYEKVCSEEEQGHIYNKLWPNPLSSAPPPIMLALTDQYNDLHLDGQGPVMKYLQDGTMLVDNSAELADGDCISVYSAESV